MTGPWSGLGPAVDAHLQQWARAQRSLHLASHGARQDTGRTDEEQMEAIAHVMTDDYLRRWIHFGLTYGVVNPNGVPMPVTGMAEGATIVGREQEAGEEIAVAQGLHLYAQEMIMLDKATSHYVSAEVVDEVSEAADLAHPEPLYAEDVFTPDGFAVLEKPIWVPDLDSETGLPRDDIHVAVRAIGWTTRHDIVRIGEDDMRLTNEEQRKGIRLPSDRRNTSGLVLFTYTTYQDYNGSYVPEMRAIGREVIEMPPTIGFPFQVIDVMPWSFGRSWMVRDEVGYVPGTVPSSVGWMRRWFYSFMRLCWQQIIVRRPGEAKRHELRRWDRLAKKKELLDYTVLRLRRTVDPGYRPSGLGVPLEHRVLVRKHWAFAYCASMGGPVHLSRAEIIATYGEAVWNKSGTKNPANHRWVWIEPYWKGPEDGEIGPLWGATSVTR